MTGGLYIGRIVDTRAFENISAIRHEGGRLDIAGRLILDDVDAAKTVLEQLQGHWLNTREGAIPIRYDKNPNIDGLYLPDRSGGFSGEIGPGDLERGWFAVQLRARRAVDAWQQPPVNVLTHGADRTGKPGGVTARPWSAWPSTVAAYTSEGTTLTVLTRTGPGHTGNTNRDIKWATSSVFYDRHNQMILPVENWYDMAAQIEVGGEIVTGPHAFTRGNMNDWRISNGLVEISGTTGSYFAQIGMPKSASTTEWGSQVGFQVGYYNTILGWQNIYGPDSIEVLQVTPELVAARFTIGHVISGAPYAYAWEVSLRRGSMVIDVNAVGPGTNKWGVGFNTATVTTGITSGGGDRYNANDADTNRWCLLNNDTYTSDAVNGRIYISTAAASAQFGIGANVGGSGAADPNRDTDLRDQWFGPTGEIQTLTLV